MESSLYTPSVLTCCIQLFSIRIRHLIILILSDALTHQALEQVASRLTLKSVSFVECPHNYF